MSLALATRGSSAQTVSRARQCIHQVSQVVAARVNHFELLNQAWLFETLCEPQRDRCIALHSGDGRLEIVGGGHKLILDLVELCVLDQRPEQLANGCQGIRLVFFECAVAIAEDNHARHEPVLAEQRRGRQREQRAARRGQRQA
jgi:hypothetical protein